MSFYVGAYASSPCTSGWNPELESSFYEQLKRLPNMAGLEHPFLGESLHAHDDDWFLANIDSSWNFVLTCVPGTMGAIGKNPNFGIASSDEEGRQLAIEFLARARDAVVKLNNHCGRNAVKAIEIQTAPNQSKASSSAEALTATLETILGWDWQGASIVIEHCDTLVEGQTPVKGFLSLEDEINAVKTVNAKCNSNIGIVINWGRSAIETRSVDGVIDHINQAKTAGLLTGLMFSGVSATECPYGVWADTHMPAAASENSEIGAEHSLMTEAEIHKCIAAAGKVDILGIKLGIRPKDELIDNRIAYNREAMAMMSREAKS